MYGKVIKLKKNKHFFTTLHEATPNLYVHNRSPARGNRLSRAHSAVVVG